MLFHISCVTALWLICIMPYIEHVASWGWPMTDPNTYLSVQIQHGAPSRSLELRPHPAPNGGCGEPDLREHISDLRLTDLIDS